MKILSEKYLQQRIEELEGYKDEPEITELKVLQEVLTNCEEVEVEEIDSSLEKWNSYDWEQNSNNKESLHFTEWLKEQGYKLIKTK